MLSVFKPFPVAREALRLETLPERARAYARDTITLGWEERLKARGRRTSDGGAEFGTALPRGTVLVEGDCLVVDDLELVVTIVEQQEAVLVVAPRSAEEWALFAYAIGNSHQPLMVAPTTIICPDVLGMEQVLTHHGIPFRRSMSRFTPASVGVSPYAPGHQHAVEAER